MKNEQTKLDVRKNRVSLECNYEILSTVFGFRVFCSVQAAHAVRTWKGIYGFVWSFHFNPLGIAVCSHIKQVPLQCLPPAHNENYDFNK
jgi:hypothetical protein